MIAFGIALIGLGGLVSASYYTPVYRIRDWAWITSWSLLLFFAWIIFPIAAAQGVSGGNFFAIMKASSRFCIEMTLLFGILRGFGGLMNGLSYRYLGISLASSICIGVCAVFGTLIPPLIDHKFLEYFSVPSGWVVLIGLFLCLVGTFCCGYAGMLKERFLTSKGEVTDSNASGSKGEFAFTKGILIAVGGGVMSSCMAIAIKYGQPIDEASVTAGVPAVFKSVPALVLSMGGGYLTNLVYCYIVASRNHSFSDWKKTRVLPANTFWAALSGLMVYGQYFLYVMGATKLGKLEFAAWTIFMSAIILFGALWGLLLREWKETGRKTLTWLWTGIAVLIISICVIGIGPRFFPG